MLQRLTMFLLFIVRSPLDSFLSVVVCVVCVDFVCGISIPTMKSTPDRKLIKGDLNRIVYLFVMLVKIHKNNVLKISYQLLSNSFMGL